jgi:hypothetical protein
LPMERGWRRKPSWRREPLTEESPHQRWALDRPSWELSRRGVCAWRRGGGSQGGGRRYRGNDRRETGGKESGEGNQRGGVGYRGGRRLARAGSRSVSYLCFHNLFVLVIGFRVIRIARYLLIYSSIMLKRRKCENKGTWK